MTKTTRTFAPRVEILPAAQRRLWPELKDTPPQFTLYGGTALALRLGHRQSIDFDFFAGEPVSGVKLLEQIPYLRRAKVRQLAPDTLVCSVQRAGAVRLSFFGSLSLGQVDRAGAAQGPMIPVAALRDIAATKMSVVTQRAEAKDYIDIHALINLARMPLAEMLACARAVFGPGFDPLQSLKALAYHDDPGLAGLKPGLKKDLAAAIRKIDLTKLPSIKPLRKHKAKR